MLFCHAYRWMLWCQAYAMPLMDAMLLCHAYAMPLIDLCVSQLVWDILNYVELIIRKID